jgi:hypothetical protein
MSAGRRAIDVRACNGESRDRKGTSTATQRRARYSTVNIATEKISKTRNSVRKRFSRSGIVSAAKAAILSRISVTMKVSKVFEAQSYPRPTSMIS